MTIAPNIASRSKQHDVVKQYYKAIDDQMAAKKKPTIGDAIGAMCAQGNIVFMDQWSEYLKGGYAPFEDAKINHEIGHLVLRAAHTPEQEMQLIPFIMAFRDRDNKEAGNPFLFASHNFGMKIQYYDAAKKFYKDPERRPDDISNRDQAINYAMGLYLRQKMEMFHSLGLTDKSYEEQQAFAEQYAKKESVSDIKNTYVIAKLSDAELLKESLPYSLIQISPEERRSIVSMAAGLCKAAKTDYPDRLKPIEDMLRTTGLEYDKQAVLEEIRRKAAEKPARVSL